MERESGNFIYWAGDTPFNAETALVGLGSGLL